MRNAFGTALVSVVLALAIGTGFAGTAGAKPVSPLAGATASDDPANPYTFVRNSGTVIRVPVTGNSVTLTLTAPDRADCNAGVGAFTADYFIANFDRSSTLPPVDIPGPDAFRAVSPSLLGSTYYENIPPEQQSPASVVAPLAPGQYTAVAYCTYIDAAGEVDYTKAGVNYLDEFTIPSATTHIPFGSS